MYYGNKGNLPVFIFYFFFCLNNAVTKVEFVWRRSLLRKKTKAFNKFFRLLSAHITKQISKIEHHTQLKYIILNYQHTFELTLECNNNRKEKRVNAMDSAIYYTILLYFLFLFQHYNEAPNSISIVKSHIVFFLCFYYSPN